jgi:hypothetical protein
MFGKFWLSVDIFNKILQTLDKEELIFTATGILGGS